VGVLGFQSHRDNFAIALDRSTIERRASDLIDESNPDDVLRNRYALSLSWDLQKARADLRYNEDWSKQILECSYHPFDSRWCYFGHEFMDRPRRELLDHVAWRDNICLNLVRQTKAPHWRHALVSSKPTPAVFLEIKDGSSVFSVVCL